MILCYKVGGITRNRQTQCLLPVFNGSTTPPSTVIPYLKARPDLLAIRMWYPIVGTNIKSVGINTCCLAGIKTSMGVNKSSPIDPGVARLGGLAQSDSLS